MNRQEKIFNTLVGASLGLAFLTFFLFVTMIGYALLGRVEKASNSAEAVCYLLIPTFILSIAAYNAIPMDE